MRVTLHKTVWMLSSTILPILLFVTATLDPSTQVVAAAPQPPGKQEFRLFISSQVRQHSANFQKGDLVTRELGEKLIDSIEAKGWTVSGKEELLERLLPENDFLVKQLSDAKGRAFLRKIEDLPGGIDRLDQLARMPQGRANVSSLIRKVPNGAEWIEAMTSTKRGQRLGDRLSNSRYVKDFNAPTGKIYQLEKLIAELHTRLVPNSI